MKIIPFITAVISVFMPVISQKTGLSKKYGFALKMLCAFLYIITGVFSALSLPKITDYSLLILSALALGLLGDFFLEYKKKKYFALGAVFFALGHIVYSYTFLCVGEYKAEEQIAGVLLVTVLITAAIVVLAKTKLRLNGKKNMLLIYAPVLIFAFACAVFCGIVAVAGANLAFGLCLIAGGILFFASDIMIGVGKGGIRRPPILHNAVSYTYFAAQTLFALSIYFQ